MAGLTCLASGMFKYSTLKTFGGTEGSTLGADPCKSGGEILLACLLPAMGVMLPATGVMWHEMHSESGTL